MEILKILDNGQVYPAKVLSITEDTIVEAFSRSAENVTAVSLAIGFATQASVHHMMLNAFKNLACASISSGFGFKEADRLANAAAAAPKAGAPAEAKKDAKKEEKKAEPEEEEADLDMGDLFGY